jgi:hypothetical protein
MGIFNEADMHPFHETEPVVASSEESRGGSSGERWGDEHRIHDYAKAPERPRGLYIRDDNPAALLS